MKPFKQKLIPFIILLLAGCHDHDDHDHGPITNVSFDWRLPVQGSTVRLGDSLRIEGSLSYPTEMHGYEVVVSKFQDSAVALFSSSEHAHGTALTVGKKWKNGLADSTLLLVKVEVARDHSGTSNQVFRRTVWAVD
jgi:hypothetical protein